MAGHAPAGAAIEPDALATLADRYATSRPPAWSEVEGALERGFGTLISLEAKLDRIRRGGEQSSEHAETDTLMREIDRLRKALGHLREVSAHQPAPLAQGFVLPPRTGSRLS